MEIETSQSKELAEEQMEVEDSEEMKKASDPRSCDVSPAFAMS